MESCESLFDEASIADEEIFARKNSQGNYDTFYADQGEDVTRLNANVYPIGSDTSAKYEHPEGISLSIKDVKKLKIPIE